MRVALDGSQTKLAKSLLGLPRTNRSLDHQPAQDVGELKVNKCRCRYPHMSSEARAHRTARLLVDQGSNPDAGISDEQIYRRP